MCEYLLVMKTPPGGEGVCNATTVMKQLKMSEGKETVLSEAKCSMAAHIVSEHQQVSCSDDKSTHPSLHG